MSESFEGVFDGDKDWNGCIIVNVHFEAKDDVAADRLADALKSMQAQALSEAEPGCTMFHVARAGRLLTIFEKHSGVDAIKHHLSTDLFKEMNAKGDQVFAKPPRILYYKEI